MIEETLKFGVTVKCVIEFWLILSIDYIYKLYRGGESHVLDGLIAWNYMFWKL